MNGLKNRGVENILSTCVDGFSDFPQAIEAVYLQTKVQQCIIHQIRSSTPFSKTTAPQTHLHYNIPFLPASAP